MSNRSVVVELPDVIHAELQGWAGAVLDESVESVLSALAYELAQNEELRAFTARLLPTL
ncbi:hypothetical protein [Pseudonocardia oroxyli]|uniref:Uncharacterized protein n=1 Tax=Pseudonocardia oroxyli TaxID=366584 RepID=A0A1G7SYU3_PSEOR|nr:hypothetical protein [Pseudonocardia oroxyli]SDG27944.1 hypothetical protein SAMN05216377_110136 [Pseudonocardia oroxyli]